jgi:DNA mismatch repair protein MutL
MEIRLKNGEEIYQLTYHLIRDTLAGKEMIPKISLSEQQEKKEETVNMPEPFEQNRRKQFEGYAYGRSNQEPAYHKVAEKNADYIKATEPLITSTSPLAQALTGTNRNISPAAENSAEIAAASDGKPKAGDKIVQAEQMYLFSGAQAAETEEPTPFLSKEAVGQHRIIGQVFATYWLVEYKKELYIIDQHAAHEKVLYERIMAAAKSKGYASQQLLPPIVLSLTLKEAEILKKHEEVLNSLGYEFEHFGGNEYSVRAVPADLYSLSEKELIIEFIDTLAEDVIGTALSSASILERTASLSCKAAVKANHAFSHDEAAALIKELLTLENPYHCPHGRPVIISMSQYELERKFKRIV